MAVKYNIKEIKRFVTETICTQYLWMSIFYTVACISTSNVNIEIKSLRKIKSTADGFSEADILTSFFSGTPKRAPRFVIKEHPAATKIEFLLFLQGDIRVMVCDKNVALEARHWSVFVFDTDCGVPTLRFDCFQVHVFRLERCHFFQSTT